MFVGGVGHVVPIIVAYHPGIGAGCGEDGVCVGGFVGRELAPCKAGQGGIQQQLRQAEHGETGGLGGEDEARGQRLGTDGYMGGWVGGCTQAWRSR